MSFFAEGTEGSLEKQLFQGWGQEGTVQSASAQGPPGMQRPA